MSGNQSGGLAAAQKNKASDPDFYKKIGAKGGKVSGKPKGFAYAAANGLDWHKAAGQKGGTISRRNK